MRYALAESDYSKIKNFYYYKICDSIISLDVSLENINDKKYIESPKKIPESKKDVK